MGEYTSEYLSISMHFLQWLMGHPLAFFTGLSAFFISLWSGLQDGLKKSKAFLDACACVLITLAVVAVMKFGGMHSSWMPLIGVLVGFIGALRIREAILGAWETRKNKILEDNEKSEK